MGISIDFLSQRHGSRTASPVRLGDPGCVSGAFRHSGHQKQSLLSHGDPVPTRPRPCRATADDLDVHVRDWSAQRQDDVIHLRAREGEYALELKLSLEKPPALHGTSGYSRKGDSANQASYYYSFTRLKAEGTITFKGYSSCGFRTRVDGP